MISTPMGDDMKCSTMGKMLEDGGVFVDQTVSPALPPGGALTSTSHTATDTEEEMDRVLDTFKTVGKSVSSI